jgi:hypothetical protein
MNRSLAGCLSVALTVSVLAPVILTAPAAALPPDIRNRSFTSPFQGVFAFGGRINDLPIDTNPLRVPAALTPTPHTFDVLPDPAFPLDPTRIRINTRLLGPEVLGQTSMCPAAEISLFGTYNQLTGAIAVQGTRPGLTVYDLGVQQDPFGLFMFPTRIMAKLMDFSLSLSGTLTEAGPVLTITGTNAPVPIGGPGNITVSSAEVLANLPENCDPALALTTLPVTGAYGGVTNWTATVPTPGGLMTLGLATLLVARRRR